MPLAQDPPLLALSGVVERYAAIISDVWGVIHNGAVATVAACEALRRARAAGRPVLLVSNAPRPAADVIAQLDALGVPRDCYDDILTSGDLTRAKLAEDSWAWVHAVGPPHHRVLYEGLDVTFADPEEADIAVVSGLVDDERETPEDYRGLVETYLEYEVPMLCANPDLVVERGDKLIHCAGGIAALYEAMGGEVTYLGKPHAPVYAQALERLSGIAGRTLAARDVLAIGDAVRTDMIGARDAGHDALFLAGGIHAAEAGSADAIDRAALRRLFESAGVAPIGVAWHLGW